MLFTEIAVGFEAHGATVTGMVKHRVGTAPGLKGAIAAHRNAFGHRLDDWFEELFAGDHIRER